MFVVTFCLQFYYLHCVGLGAAYAIFTAIIVNKNATNINFDGINKKVRHLLIRLICFTWLFNLFTLCILRIDSSRTSIFDLILIGFTWILMKSNPLARRFYIRNYNFDLQEKIKLLKLLMLNTFHSTKQIN